MAEKGLEITARAEAVSSNASAVNQFPTELFSLDNAKHELSMRSPWKVKTSYGYILSFAQASAPTAEHVGDLWFDTDDDNHLYRWSGSAWVSVRDSRFEDVLTNIFSPISSSTWQDQLIVSAPPFSPVPWNRDFTAMLYSAIKTGTASSTAAFKLIDATADLSSVPIGSVVRNVSSGFTARVLAHSGTTGLWLNHDLYTSVVNYEIYAPPELPEQFIELTGALLDGDGTKIADTNTTNHLIDTDGTVWTGVLSAYYARAWNLSTGKIGYVTAVAAHDLTLQWDTFPNGNEPYLIYNDRILITDPESPLYNKYVFDMNVSGRYIGGRVSANGTEDDTLQYHEHQKNWMYAHRGDTTNIRISVTAGNNIANANVITDIMAEHSGYGPPRASDHTQPRTLSQVYIMRIK